MSSAILSVLLEQAMTNYILENAKSERHRSRLETRRLTHVVPGIWLIGASLYEKACLYMPGGNTRSALHVDPFPLTFVKGEGAIVRPVLFLLIPEEE